MFKVALTGGIASGKSRVANILESLGITVIDSDVIAREVVAKGTEGLAAIVQRFGPTVQAPDGQLDRRALRSIVFADPFARRDLEAITHPRIRARMATLNLAAQALYVVNAIPLLAETGGRRDFDRVLVVDCPENLQLARVMARDQIHQAAARSVLAAQASRAERLALADDVILNDGDLEALQRAVRTLHGRYLELARRG